MNLFKRVNKPVFKKLIVFLLIFSIGAAFGYTYFTKTQRPTQSTREEKNTPIVFISEVYDKIKNNFWDNISDAQLIDAFKNASSALGNPLPQKIETKDELLKNLDQSQAVKIVSQVLSSLQPMGRSGLFTQKQEIALKNTVENVNPEKDLYKDLGLAKGASQAAVVEAYQKHSEELKKDSQPEAQEKLKTLTYAKDVLTEEDKKERYDQKGVEPTIFTKIIKPDTLYFQFKKFSPTSLDEFQKAFDLHKDDAALVGLIFDLRGNVGGAIDATAYFLGYFLGKNQYAFDFYHKGQYLPFKTPTDKLASISKYKQVVVLVDQNTQSSAEMMAASIKKYRIGVVVGVPTKGWGTVERVFPLDNQISDTEKYSIFLVHSITLRDDNQPIEGRGIEPNINIKDSNWEQQLLSYFRNPQLNAAVKQILSGP